METGWHGRFGNNRFVFKREVRGVAEVKTLDRSLLGSLDARRLHERHAHLAEVYDKTAKLKRKDKVDTYPARAHSLKPFTRRAARASTCSATKAWAK